jgi:uncharacterized membrane protein SpoIIM required for sporulation
MILDWERFVHTERPYWEELDRLLLRLEGTSGPTQLTLDEARRLHYLYQRTVADLGKINTLATDPGWRDRLEALTARAYAEMHGATDRSGRFSFLDWLRSGLPTTFRRHAWAFALALAVTVLGSVFGGGAVAWDPGAKAVLMPFPHLLQDPRDRVRQEETRTSDDSPNASFSALLMTHNTRVAIATLALGMTWGIGTLAVLFYNGVILGAVVTDYSLAGQASFLTAWLLPHGIVEIPAILLGGQAGLVLGATLLGRRQRRPLGQRLRSITPDLVTLISGAALLLVWAGLIEAFFSQIHEPHLPYAAKIAFGIVEGLALAWYLAFCGRPRTAPRTHPTPASLAPSP